MTDVYNTLGGWASHQIRVKGSRFIGYAAPVKNREEAESFVQEISKNHHDATHNCFAYRIGLGDNSLFRYSDAGEPSGAAGKPILKAIDGRVLTDVACVVTRYFGGTKLGTGGLARAYGQCAGETLDMGEKVERFLIAGLRVVFGYDLTGAVMALISNYGCQIGNTVYGSETEMILRVRQSKAADFERDILNITGGKVRIFREEVKGR